MVKRTLIAGLVAVLAGVGLAGCDDVNSVDRPDAPVVLTGAKLPKLVGIAPGKVVAFAHSRRNGTPSWKQVPVQIDQRKVVGYGFHPPNNTVAGVTGTVYGYGEPGPTALQYADPNTWVGADSNPAFDADDELVFMAADGGGKPRSGERSEPAGVLAGSGVAVQFDDPTGTDATGWVYLFVSKGSLDPAAGRDYVDYDFALTSGSYKSTYRRSSGPNAETSTVTTPTYRATFSDRWKEVSWEIGAGAATGADVLDGHKNQFGTGTCVRSNATFAAEEGAFVANIDGPVRGIRSYVGANSGPRTQRTHLMYRDREEVVTDLRVHAIPEVMDYLDYSSAAVGMTYRSSTVPGGVPVDGYADAVPTALPTWESLDGPQGQVLTNITTRSSVATIAGNTDQFYRDANPVPPNVASCWGDNALFAASGSHVHGGIPNTDPGGNPVATLQGTRTTRFSAPPADPSKVAADATAWAARLAKPLTLTVTPYTP